MLKGKFVVVAAVIAALAVPMAGVAASLANGNDQTCGAGAVGSFHFVNNQTEGATGGTLTATFQVGNSVITVTNSNPKVLKSVLQWTVQAPAGAVLVDADSGNVPGKLVLSDFSCTDVKKK
ncbi:MAG TPA: hypothetical protein VFJ78_06055 [Gaiellaceae bacterium]|nr:hypothetical protein [Gaiellaceae bacterium]